jgi:hypothetical protein
LTGRWALQLAAWASLGPVIAVAGMLVTLILRERAAKDIVQDKAS